MTTTSNPKRIQFNRADKDYSAYYDGELIGTYATFHQAEVELDAHALDLLERGLLDTAEGITTMQWQTPRDVVYARPAELVELLHSDDPAPTGQEPGGSGGGGGSPLQRWRDQGAREQARIAALPHFNLPAAPPAVETIVHTPDTFGNLETSTAAGREDAAPMLMPEGDWLDADGMRVAPPLASTASPDPAATTAALVPLLCAVIDEWIALGEQGITTPYDAALVQLARAMAPPAPRTLDHICGEALAYEYCKAPGLFLEKFDSFGAPRQAAVTHAVATWLGVTVSEVDELWLESRLRLGYENAAQA